MTKSTDLQIRSQNMDNIYTLSELNAVHKHSKENHTILNQMYDILAQAKQIIL